MSAIDTAARREATLDSFRKDFTASRGRERWAAVHGFPRIAAAERVFQAGTAQDILRLRAVYANSEAALARIEAEVACKFCGPHLPGANGCAGWPN